jgi:hypothetical protein
MILELLAVVGDAAAGAAEGEGGRMMSGITHRSLAIFAGFLHRVRTIAGLGHSRPILSMATLNSRRSSPMRMASRLAPIIRTPYFSRTPRWQRPSRSSARSGRRGRQQRVGLFLGDDLLDHLGIDRLDVGAASANSGSVMIVAGFELMSTTS